MADNANGSAGFGPLAAALLRHAAALARARAAERRGGDARLPRSPRLLWPDMGD